MRRFFTSLLFVAIAGSFASAQQGEFGFADDGFRGKTTTALADTPEKTEKSSQFSSYEVKELSPRHQRARLKAQQRQLLIASRQWYGHSQSRPTVSANPYATSYTPLYPVVHVANTVTPRPYRTLNVGSYGWY